MQFNERVMAALRDVPDPPCEGCSCYARCARLRLACSAFEDYIDGHPVTSRWRLPDRKVYLRVFKDG